MKDKLKNSSNRFDIEEPIIGHFNRFEIKLANQNQPKKTLRKAYKYMAIVASFVLLLTIGFSKIQSSKGAELADVSPKMEETQDYFTSVINEELEKIALIKTKDNKQIIDDAFNQLKFLENNYKKQTIELKENDKNKVIIFAMISNFQQRITVLQNLLNELDNFKQLKSIHNENNNL